LSSTAIARKNFLISLIQANKSDGYQGSLLILQYPEALIMIGIARMTRHRNEFGSAAPIRALVLTMMLAVSATVFSHPVAAQDGLTGEVNVGGSMATGNTDTTRVDAEIKARYKAGRLEDNYRLVGEFSDDNGTTTAQRILGSVESRFDMQESLFVFGYLEFDDDKFSGFKYEIEGAFGAGYKVIDDDNMRLLLQAGPGYRYSKFSTPAPPALPLVSSNENEFLIRGSADFEYDVTDTVSMTNAFIVTWDSSRTKIENTTALTSALIGDLSTRLSVNIRYNTDPPLLTKKTDTLSKISLVYGF
jgi:putative salt-induced outer membrane protein